VAISGETEACTINHGMMPPTRRQYILLLMVTTISR
jgi:hypothetical protein